MAKKIDSKVGVYSITPDPILVKRIAQARGISVDNVNRVLSLNIIPSSTLTVLCGYDNYNHVMQKIRLGYLSVCYPYSIKAKDGEFKGHMFVIVDEDCINLLRKRL